MTCVKEWNEPCPYYHMRPNCPEHCQYNKSERGYCLWIEDDDGVYQTSCLHSFEFMDGTPELNGIKFCPYCGRLVRQVGEP